MREKVFEAQPEVGRRLERSRKEWEQYIGEMNTSKILTSKLTGKRPLGRPRHRWEDSIKMDLKEIGINKRNWVDLAQDKDYRRALVNVALNKHIGFVNYGVS